MTKSKAPLRPERGRGTQSARALAIDDVLQRAYPDAVCALDHETPFQLLIATILSAQCTDVRVNIVTQELFRRAPDAVSMAALDLGELEVLVHSTGFFRAKAKNILGTATLLVEQHGGEVPSNMEALLRLPGVARKTANVVLGTAFQIASGVVVDTHVQRICNLLGLVKDENPTRIEQSLMSLLPAERWIGFSHRIILHGRAVCIANRPRCAECTLASLCPSASALPARKT
ncbi:MAG: endonuclease III [Planctomycetes bacterium]|nr:endonuclease III [Planctomycetota bacterium]